MNATAQQILERVQRYALRERDVEASGTWLRQRGRIRSGPDHHWMPFRAEQRYDARQLEFRWIATARIARVIPARVIDAFTNGHGRFEVSVFGVRVQRLPPGKDTDASEFRRFIAELPWCPVAFNHPSLSWSAVDGNQLRVNFDHHGIRGTVDLLVNEAGCVLEARAGHRGRQVGKTIIPTAWWGRYGAYRQFGDLRLPTTAEVFWAPAEGEYPYVQIEVLDACVMQA